MSEDYFKLLRLPGTDLRAANCAVQRKGDTPVSVADHVAYFQSRAQSERKLAEIAPAAHISQIHLDMAARYEELVVRPERRNLLKAVGDPSGPERNPS